MHFREGSRLNQPFFDKAFQEMQFKLSDQQGMPTHIGTTQYRHVTSGLPIPSGPTTTRTETQTTSDGKVITRTYINGQLVDNNGFQPTPVSTNQYPKLSEFRSERPHFMATEPTLTTKGLKGKTTRTETEFTADGKKITRVFVDNTLDKITEENVSGFAKSPLTITNSPSITRNKISIDSEPSRLPTQDSSIDLKLVAETIMTLLNQYRRQQGSLAVTSDPELFKLSVAHSQDMNASGALSHKGFPKRVESALTYKSGKTLENVAYIMNSGIKSSAKLAEAIIDNWKESPPHNKNMLDSIATHANVGVAMNGVEFYATMILTKPLR